MNFCQGPGLAKDGSAEILMSPKGFIIDREKFSLSRHPGRCRGEGLHNLRRQLRRIFESRRQAGWYRQGDMLRSHLGRSGWPIYIDDKYLSIARNPRGSMTQKTMGGFNLTGYCVDQAIYTPLDTPRPCHRRRASTSLDMTFRSLQQYIALGKLCVV